MGKKRYSIVEVLLKGPELNEFQVFIMNAVAFVFAITLALWAYLWFVGQILDTVKLIK